MVYLIRILCDLNVDGIFKKNLFDNWIFKIDIMYGNKFIGILCELSIVFEFKMNGMIDNE